MGVQSKHKHTEVTGEEQIPEKRRKIKLEQNADSEDDDSREFKSAAANTPAPNGNEADEPKFPKGFKMRDFRQKLQGHNFIPELQYFVNKAKVNPDIVAKYMEKKGNPLELAEAFDRVDKSQLFHISYACNALQLVLMEVITHQQSQTETGINASRYFLRNHGNLVGKLLQSPNTNHRRSIIKLLTAIVCLEPQLGRQILTSFDFLTSTKSMEELLSHSKVEINVGESVRKCYINFILSYLIDGNILLIRNLLDKYNLINALLSGLVYDDHVTVCVVLNTLKKYVLESLEISKTKKIHAFDAANLKHVMKLYQWKGPRYYAGFMDKKKKTNLNNLIDTTEQKAVAQAAHGFLIVLLTSRKYGIAFDVISNMKQKHNFIQKQILINLDAPWLDELKSDLVIKILKACPELARGSIKRYSTCLNSKVKNWESLATFMTKLISELHPSVMRGGLETITQTDFFYWMKDICLCPEALILLKGCLKSNEFKIRLLTVRLLLVMFEQFCNYVNTILKRERSKGNDMRKFKFDVMNHVFVHSPSIQTLCKSLYKSIKANNDENVNVLEHLEATFDLILIISKNFRSFVDKTTSVVNYIELLRPLYQSDAATEYKVRLELKAVKVILLLIPQSLKPEEEHFAHVVQSFIYALVHGTGNNQKEAGSLLRGIFVNLRLFQKTDVEVDIWLEALKFISPKCLENVKDVLPKILRRVCKYSEHRIVPKEHKCDVNISKLFENIENGNIIQGSAEGLSLSGLMSMSLKYNEEYQEKDNKLEEAQENMDISEYLEVVSLLLFHYFPSPEVIQQIYSEHSNVHSKYMSTWLNKHKPGKLASKSIRKYSKLYKSILDGKENFQDLFVCPKDDANAVLFLLDEKEVYLNKLLESERLVLVYIHLITFIVAQFVKNSALDNSRATACLHYLLYFMKVLAYLQGQEESIEEMMNSTEEEKSLSYLELALKYFYCNHLELLQGFNAFASEDSGRNFLTLICELTTCVDSLKLTNMEFFTVHYRSKIINQLAENVKTKNENEDILAIRAFEVFQMNATNCVDILNVLTQLHSERFYTSNTSKSLYFDILVYVLNRLAELRTFQLSKESVTKVAEIYMGLVKSSTLEINLEKLEESLNNFLVIAHQFLPHIPSELFTSIFEAKKLTKSTVNLASILLERRSDLNERFMEKLANNISKKELVYPLLNVFLSKNLDIERKLLGSLYQEYKNGFLKTVEKPLKAGVIYKENVENSIYLIEQCMPLSECLDFCKKNLKVDSVEIFQLKVIETIYKKSIESSDSDAPSIFINFINTLIQLFLLILRRDQIDYVKLKMISYMAYNWHRTYKGNNHCDFTKIITGQPWSQFSKNCLKHGMQVAGEEEQTTEVNNDIGNGHLLKTLALFINILFEDSSADSMIEQLFEMALSHSKFLDIVSTQKPTEVKTELMHLLYVLVNKNKTMLESNHIPILLGAYQAKLSLCDRYILALLQFYEKNGISLHEYRPFIWSDSAIAHYSIKEKEEKYNLQQQEPSVLQVMSLIDRQISDLTIENFPIWRKLNTLNQLPENQFEDPSSCLVSFGSNKLERDIEAGVTTYEESFLRLCPKRDETYDDCYDPAFIIPLMSMAFAPEIYSQPVRPVQNGLLGIVFAALSSQDKEMRLAAGCVQLRYRQHFENSYFSDKPIWSQAYDNIQNGLHNLSQDWAKHKKSGIPRVPYISGLFLIKSMNLLIDPNDPMYKVLSMYLRLKSAFNFLCVPEFHVLFHSSEIDHQNFRNFIVDVIHDGIKCSSDLLLLVTTNTFKALMGFYGSTMSNIDVNSRILSVISTCCKIPASSKLLIEHVGVLSWINTIIENIEFYHFDTVEGIISTISNLWYSLKAKESEFYNFQDIESNMFYMLVKLSSKLSGRISLNNFVRFLNILSKTAHKNHQVLDGEILEKIINCAERHFEEHIWYVNNIKSNGADGVESEVYYCKRLQNLGLDNTSILGLLSLRNFVVEWTKC